MAALPYPTTPDPVQGFFDLDVPPERLDLGAFVSDRGWTGYFAYKMTICMIGALIRDYERKNGEGSWKREKAHLRWTWPGVTSWAADVYEEVAEEIQVAEFGAVVR